jgi:hypothetical protein
MRVAGAALVAAITTLATPAVLDGVLMRPISAQAQIAEPMAVRLQVAALAKKKGPEAKKGSAPTKKGTVAAKKGAAAAKKATAEAKKAAPAPPVASAGSYANMPLAERVGIQFDLAWSGHFNGLINGEFNDRALAARSKEKQEQVGWRMVDDKATGVQVGLPTAQVPNLSPGRRGTRWSSAQGQVQVETFRIREPGTTLASVFEQQKQEPAGRRIDVNLLRNDFFVLAGMQGLKKFYVRAEARDLEVRGITILWDQATQGIMDPLVVVMASAFAPFPGSGIAALLGPPPRRKVDYGTGIVVSAGGHILADRQVTDGCNVIEVSGHGAADLIAGDATAGLSLLRVYGASDLVPAALAQDSARAGDLTLVGIADPQTQGGGRAVSTVAARVTGEALQPVPQLGFAGAIALDGQGRVAGMVTLKAPVVASAGGAPPPQAAVVPAETVRKFLEAQNVAPASGRSNADAIKAALVRVICVRR